MMYIETITDDEDTFRIERQKNTPNGEWYGLYLYKSSPVKTLADNDSFIHDLPIFIEDNPTKAMKEMGIETTEENIRLIRKVVKKAIKLGWFSHLEPV